MTEGSSARTVFLAADQPVRDVAVSPGRGPARDDEAFTKLAERVCALVEDKEPGTLRYECFVDEENGQFVWHELYEDASPFFAHKQHLQGAGVMAEVGQIVEFSGMTVLGEVEDPKAHEALEQFGAAVFHRLTGVVR